MKPGVILCFVCKRIDADAGTCEAFPGGVPGEMIVMNHDHRTPFEGDHGILWEPDLDAIGEMSVERLAAVGIKKSDYVKDTAPPDGDAE